MVRVCWTGISIAVASYQADSRVERGRLPRVGTMLESWHSRAMRVVAEGVGEVTTVWALNTKV